MIRWQIHKFYLIIIIFACLSCKEESSEKKVLSIKEFTIKYDQFLKTKFPNTKFTLVDDSTITSDINNDEVRISSDNAYRDYIGQPDSLNEVLNRYTNVVSELFTLEKLSLGKIVPIIKPVEFADIFISDAGSDSKINTKLVYDNYNDQLIIAYAFDSGQSIQYMTSKDFEDLQVNRDSLKSIAMRNLTGYLNDIEKTNNNDIYGILAGGTYEASLILIPTIFNKENFNVNGNVVIAIPNRDILLITGNKDKEKIKKMKEISSDLYKNGSYAVSPFLFIWNGTKFVEFKD